MAKILMSGIGIVDIRGKIQGTVMSKGRSSATARVKVTPVNPQTVAQQAIRSVFSYFSAKFRTLGATVVAAWNAAAGSGFSSTNIFGQPFNSTGHGLYIGLNMNLNSVEVAELTNPPAPAGVSSPINFDPSADNSSTELFASTTFTGGGTAVPAGTALVVLATAPLSGGVSFVKGKYRVIDFIDAAADTAATNLWSAYATKFGALSTGKRVGLSVVAINKTTGEAGIPFNQIITVAA